jgi:hypothetical protein
MKISNLTIRNFATIHVLRIPSSEMLRRVALIRADFSEEGIPSIFIVKRLFLCSMLLLLFTANDAHSSQILFTLMMEAIQSSETSIFTTATRSHIPDEDILHSHCRENLRSYIALTGWAV